MDGKAEGNIQVWNSVTSNISCTTPTGALNTYQNSPPFESSPISYHWPNPSSTLQVRKQFQISIPSGFTQARFVGGQATAAGCNCSNLVVESWSSDNTYFNAYTAVSWATLTSWPTSLLFTVTIEFNTGNLGATTG